MHLSVNNHDTSTSILSIKEIVGIIIVFSLVLYLVFPKDDIDKILEGKGENTNLSINYLESMLLYYPNSVKLKRILIRNYDYAGKKEKALALVSKLLIEIEDTKILGELYKMEYLLNKDIYFKTGDKELLTKIKDKLYDYFGYAYDEKGDIDYMFFLAEATQMDFSDLKYIALDGLMKQDPKLADYAFEKEVFRLALVLDDKENAYKHLLRLLEYDELEDEIKVYAIGSLIEHNEKEKAKELSIKLLLDSKKPKEISNYFNIALYTTDGDINSTRELLSLYRNSRELNSSDIKLILNSLLQIGDTKGASLFATSLFKTNPNLFDEKTIEIAINSLIYNQKLDTALDVSYYAYHEFNDTKWLDKTIQLSSWSSKMKKVIELNKEGYKNSKIKKYEEYLLKLTNLNSAYSILGDIYKNRVESGDYSMVNKVAEYYNYIGAIPQAESYFLKLLQEHKEQNIHKQAIIFSYSNSHFKQGLKLYESYKKRYGIDKYLQKESITKLLALKKFKKAYKLMQELEGTENYDKKLQAILSRLKLHDKFRLHTKLTDLAWIHRDYKYIYDILWKREKRDRLSINDYEKLISLEESSKEKSKLTYLYKRAWKKTDNSSYIDALLSFYIENRNPKKFKELIDSLDLKHKEKLEKKINYKILLANYYIQTSQIKKAEKIFLKALNIDTQNASTHQSYLWFLIDNRLTKALKNEIALLRKKHKLQEQVGFASVVGSFMLQNTNLALRWLEPLLKSSNNIEYQVVYADILQLQDREAGASSVRRKLFHRLNQMVKKSPELLKDKGFARVYLRMVVFYMTPYEKKALYFKKFKKLFTPEEFTEIEVGWYAYKQSDAQAKYLSSKYNLDIPWLNFYLALNRDNKELKQRLLHNHKSILAFRDRVIASIDIGDRADAYTLAFAGLEDNSRDTNLYKIFDDMVNSDYPKGKFSSKWRDISPNISVLENSASYKWELYKGIESEVSSTQYKYQRERGANTQDTVLSLSLRNSYEKFLWDITIANHNTEQDFVSAEMDLNYKLNGIFFGIDTKYQNRTKQTPKLETQAIEDSILFKLNNSIDKRTKLTLKHRESTYKEIDGEILGNSKHTQLSVEHILHAGYPDMKFNAYLGYNQYENRVNYTLLPNDFLEFGTQFSMGVSAKDKIQRSWRPFGSIGLAVNDNQNIGTSLSLGVSGAIKGEDIFSLLVDYSKGIDRISQPYYGVHLEYKF